MNKMNTDANTAMKEMVLFSKQFDEYAKTIPCERGAELMKNHPGEEWRIMLIKESGIDIPKQLQSAIEVYEYRKLAEQIRMEPFQQYYQTFQPKEVKNLDYSRFKEFYRENYNGKLPDKHEFVDILSSLIK